MSRQCMALAAEGEVSVGGAWQCMALAAGTGGWMCVC